MSIPDTDFWLETNEFCNYVGCNGTFSKKMIILKILKDYQECPLTDPVQFKGVLSPRTEGVSKLWHG